MELRVCPCDNKQTPCDRFLCDSSVVSVAVIYHGRELPSINVVVVVSVVVKKLRYPRNLRERIFKGVISIFVLCLFALQIYKVSTTKRFPYAGNIFRFRNIF